MISQHRFNCSLLISIDSKLYWSRPSSLIIFIFFFRRSIRMLPKRSTTGWGKTTSGIRNTFLRPSLTNPSKQRLRTRTDSSVFVTGPKSFSLLILSWNAWFRLKQNSILIDFVEKNRKRLENETFSNFLLLLVFSFGTFFHKY